MLCNKTWASDISTQTCLNDQSNVSSQAKIVMMKCNPNPYVLCVNCWVLFDFRGKVFHEGPHNCNRTVDLMPFSWKFVLPKHFFSFSIVTSSPPPVLFINLCCFIYVLYLNVILLKPPSEVKISIKFSCHHDQVLAVHFINQIQVVTHGAIHQSINQINFYLQSSWITTKYVSKCFEQSKENQLKLSWASKQGERLEKLHKKPIEQIQTVQDGRLLWLVGLKRKYENEERWK